jgi:hypothetical protein
VLGLALGVAGLATMVLLKGVVARLAILVLVPILILGVSLATDNVAVREQPHIALSSTTDDGGIAALSIKAGGASLRPDDDMLTAPPQPSATT